MVDATLALPEGHAADDPRAGRARPQGRASSSCSTSCGAGLRALPRRRQGVRDRRRAEAEEDREAHDRRRGRPPARCAPDVQAAARRDLRDRAAPRRRPRARGRDGQRGSAEHLFSAQVRLPVCNYSLPELEPRLFSFNNPVGACPRCDGLGAIDVFDPKRVVAFPSLSLASGAVKGWDRRNQFYFSAAAERSRSTSASTSTRRSRSCPSACSRCCCTARATRRSRSSTRPRRGGKPHGQARACVRRHPAEPRAPLPRDRFGRGARGAARST